jgi:glycosyltransferase involved in cell wall biosynthesis
MTHKQRCIYVTQGWGVHDERWVQALVDLDFETIVIRFGIDAVTIDELQDRVERAASQDAVILAGPLDSVTRHLVDLDVRVVGLSWGFDLYDMEDLSWLQLLDGVIVDSLATYTMCVDAGVAADNLTRIPWGVDLSVFTPEGTGIDPHEWNIPPGAEILLSLRAHESRYRISDILDAFNEIAHEFPHTYLVVGHSGSLTAHIRAQAEALGITDRVRFIGSVDEKHVAHILRSARIYISASEVDGSSVTLLQALACGVAAVVSDTPGNREWMGDVNPQALFSIGDATALANCLRAELLRGSHERDQSRRNGMSVVAEHADWANNLYRITERLRPYS